ncbi:MAG: hypothetical protein RL210_912, partial [Pseudomonadota bacterium]
MAIYRSRWLPLLLLLLACQA